MLAPMWTLKHQVWWSCDTRAQDSFFLFKSTQCFQNMLFYQFMPLSVSILGIRENFHSIHPSGVETFFSKILVFWLVTLSKEKLESISFRKHVGFIVNQFFESGDNACNLIPSIANLFRNSLRVYVLFDLLTWQFWVTVMEPLNQSIEIPGFVAPFFLFKKHRWVRTFDLPLGSLEAHARCPSLPQCRALRYQSLSFIMTL